MPVRSLNKVMIIGNLTRDPNLRYTPNGTAVCSFGLATNRSWTPADGGEKQERVDYHNIVAWSKLADICGQLLHKGDKVYVEGRLQTRDWKGEDGQERKTTEIVIDNMILLRSSSGGYGGDAEYNAGGSSNDGEDEGGQAARPAKKPSRSRGNQVEEAEAALGGDSMSADDVADDIPF